ncbi:phosphorylase b kinase gamma catalytic chain, skeletal muscle/heart isoform isoform X2 [Condylostylus longicornis]|uniref:phosphorylase b kinase gamma catalytic chain, skeletal muscle/heart isoform isoform X2 n=1 Tax=Condylostylus longicornis TaxID=2530218 RepID=UPI00244E51EA|nr:phosphorylase b kinase gamma catalytic chain, skeletal muscle/heart isoform isoform X2 [Condylostylus longicornis]
MGAEEEIDDDILPDKDAAKGFYAKYEPKEILGRGVSSTVRRCICKETGREYAAKIIDLGGLNDSDEMNPQSMKEQTRQEIAILRQVMGHPYIIDLQDIFESDAFYFLVFELCPRGELFDYLTSVVTLSEKKTRHIMRQIFEGVEYIHSKNIVHRDLKPENILLDDNYNVKITDFGFARQLQDNQKLTDLCGTPGYLAPETIRCSMYEGSPGYSKEVDIWACGVIMFTLLVGCPPFWHRKQMTMLRNIMEGKYSFTSPEWADISEDPKDLIRKCLVVDPAKRITVREVLKHPFFNQMLFEEDITQLKRKLSMKSRRMSRITELALVTTSFWTKQCFNFKRRLRKQSRFNARKKFQFAIMVVRAMIRIKRLRYTAEPLRAEDAIRDPYRVKILRKVIDGCAFRVYGHWVKKGEGQNRAALFENTPRTELHAIYLKKLQSR